MIVQDKKQFRAALPPSGRVIGIDLGTKTLGLALSDLSRAVATPMLTLERARLARDLDRLAALCAEHAVAGLVLGLPINMDGSEGRRCQATRQFARDLERRLRLPILLWDERLSTAAVERAMIAADLSRKRRGALIDKAAAAYILQGALDALAGADLPE
jgi:putative Holliday junction resolvase